MRVEQLQKYEWQTLSERAHLVVFNKTKAASTERIDFALVVEGEDGQMLQYVTCRELDASSLYWQYGGSFPGTKDTILSWRAFQALLRWVKEYGFKRISFYVENTNTPMLKLAMKGGFHITGVRNFQGAVLLEHLKEFENE